MEYRKDIQILRGISVLLVVLFHLEIAGADSGFLGVDVFFVISGFLMAVLYRDSAREFFSRRARRLLPAYFATVAATLVAAAFIVLPDALSQVVSQSLYATFFSSNIGFWTQTSYFNKEHFSPLLHLWSLGVEIQFYLIVPLLVWMFRRIRSGLLLALLGSAAACFFIAQISSKTAFFMMPLRLWEFLLGYGVAAYMTNSGNVIRPALSWLGALGLLTLLAIPLMPHDIEGYNFLTGHPGLFALLVALGTAAVLAFGLPRQLQYNRAGDALERLGKYSYSVYLAHFPIIVLYLYEPFSGTRLRAENIDDLLTLCVLIAIGSYALYHLVEDRGRRFDFLKKGALPVPAAILLLSASVHASPLLKYSDAELTVFSAWTDRAEYRCGTLFRALNPTAASCEITDEIDKAVGNVLLVGNSHADSIKTAFAAAANRHGYRTFFLVPNNPLMPGGMPVEAVINEALTRQADSIVLHYSPGSITADVIQKLVADANKHEIKVSLIKPVPVYEQHIPQAMWTHLTQQRPLPTQTRQDYMTRNSELFSGLEMIESEHFRDYDVVSRLCTQKCVIKDSAGNPAYFDSGHLTLSGARLLTPVFEKVLQDVAIDDIKLADQPGKKGPPS